MRNQWEANSLTYRWGNWRLERERVTAGMRLWILSPLGYYNSRLCSIEGKTSVGTLVCVYRGRGWSGAFRDNQAIYIWFMLFISHSPPFLPTWSLDPSLSLLIRKLGARVEKGQILPYMRFRIQISVLSCLCSFQIVYRLYRVGQKVSLHFSITSYKNLNEHSGQHNISLVFFPPRGIFVRSQHTSWLYSISLPWVLL